MPIIIATDVIGVQLLILMVILTLFLLQIILHTKIAMQDIVD